MPMNNAFLIRWYGPFYSTEEVKYWESDCNESFNLYLISGQKKYAKKAEHYYVGQTIRSVHQRFSDKGHHINELPRISEIWIGCFANKHPKRCEINIAENMLTAYLAQEIGESNILNRINKIKPNDNVYILSEWYKTTCDEVWKRKRLNSPSNLIPDVIAYRIDSENQDTLFISNKLKQINW